MNRKIINIEFKPLEYIQNNGLNVFFIKNDLKIPTVLDTIDHFNLIPKFIANRNFSAKLNEFMEVSITDSNNNALSLLLVGLGEEQNIDIELVQNLATSLAAKTEAIGMANANFYISNEYFSRELVREFFMVFYTETYSFTKYFNKKQYEYVKKLKSVNVCTRHYNYLHKNSPATLAILEGVTITKDLVSEPSNILYPETFADLTTKLKDMGVEVKILDLAKMQDLSMNALLAVAKGSTKKPYTVIMEWCGTPDNDKIDLGLVGKGLTFDSGGINLKTNPSTMKTDMAGAATVVGAIYALAKQKSNVNVVGIIGLVENMPSGNALKPDDIIVSMSEQTIEIDNTDAEGRLVLADLLWYIQKFYSPKTLIDFATLTGAIRAALGDCYAGLFSNDKALSHNLYTAGLLSQDRVWEFPLHEHYNKMNDSHIADIKNCAKEVGAVTAAQFLQNFVIKNTSWAHIDIAGVAYRTNFSKDNKLNRATGFGVRLINDYIDKCF